MNKERNRFWVTCPSCKRKFGIRPQTVLKYVDRLFGELGKEIESEGKERARKQEKES